VRRFLLERQLILGAVAVLGIAVSLAITTRHRAHIRQAALPASQGSYTALVGTSSPPSDDKAGCGFVIGPTTMGIASPVLPCGVRLYLSFRGKHALAPVIARGPAGPGMEFGLTRPLARRLGINGVRRVHWSYAAAG